MTLIDFKKLPPESRETKMTYCRRLEAQGYDEMFLRKALAFHYNMALEDMAPFLEQFPTARLRHIETLRKLHPNRTTYSLTIKLARNLGLSPEQASTWIEVYETDFAQRPQVCPTHVTPAKPQ
ncbi:hypothetical protein NBRC116594_37960 [Shimia sp. NS0008-38b]|uniref:hypothetical protein n=1 Tax=Shimia sp. NS0008-38b TaxID=3127653 RepID=UPI003109D8B7